ncbi:MAG: LysE family translocator [Pseudomonadota bacterium]
MNLALLAAFWAISMMFVITPGADWAYAISAGLRDRAIIPAIGGLLLGHLLATLVVAAGIAGMIAAIPFALTALTLIGSAYLLWLGLGLIANPPVLHSAAISQDVSWHRWAMKGFGVSGLNPKVILLFLALLPQFVDARAAWPVPMQIVGLGGMHILNCGVVYLAVAHGSKAVLRTRPQAARVVGRVSGAVMIGLALFLIMETGFGR